MYKNISTQSIHLVDYNLWGLKTNPPSLLINSDDFASIGTTTLKRAILKVERNFMVNTDDLRTFDELKENGELNETMTIKVILTDQEKVGAFLDMILLLKSDLTGWRILNNY